MCTAAAVQVSAPSKQVREQLIMRYVPLARRTVKQFKVPYSGALDHEDICGFATLGLIDAVDRFDHTRGVKFETYAVTRIRGFVTDQLRALDWMPRSTRARVRLVKHTAYQLEESLGRIPATKELAHETGLPDLLCARALVDAACRVSSLDIVSRQGDDGQDARSAQTIEDEASPNPVRNAEQTELRREVVNALTALPRRESMVLRLRYVDEQSHRAIAGFLGISESRVSQLHAQGLSRMRQVLLMDQQGLTSRQLSA